MLGPNPGKKYFILRNNTIKLCNEIFLNNATIFKCQQLQKLMADKSNFTLEQ